MQALNPINTAKTSNSNVFTMRLFIGIVSLGVVIVLPHLGSPKKFSPLSHADLRRVNRFITFHPLLEARQRWLIHRLEVIPLAFTGVTLNAH